MVKGKGKIVSIVVFILLCISVTAVYAAGDRTTPYRAMTKHQFTLKADSSNKSKTAELQLLEFYNGSKANLMIANENRYNKVPASDEEWLLMKFNMKYIDGPSEELKATDIIYSRSSFYTKNGEKITSLDAPSFVYKLKGLSQVDVSLKIGEESAVWYGMLVKKTVGYPLVKIANGADSNYSWLSTDPSTVEPFNSVVYNRNESTKGASPIDSEKYANNVELKVLGNTGSLIRTDYTFAGWNTKADGSGTNYESGDTLEMGTANVTLYAKWMSVKPNTGISLDNTNLTLKLDATTNLIATEDSAHEDNKDASWVSSNNKVATVDNNGKVIAVGKGTAIIKVTSTDGSYANCEVIVYKDQIIIPMRYAGVNRFETAVKVSNAGWGTSENVVLSNANGFADALTGVPFAYIKDAPILLTAENSIPQVTKDEISRLGAKNIYILGGRAAVSQEVENNLKSNGFNVFRVAGINRFETALEIGSEVLKNNSSKTAVLTTAFNYPDALAISSYAAMNKYPILYTQANTLNESTKKFLRDKGITKIIVPGGLTVVSENVVKELERSGIIVERVSGTDRYITALNIVTRFKSSFKEEVMIATGNNFPDALAGGVLAAKKQIPILLVNKNAVKDEVKDYIKENVDGNMYILGGTAVILEELVDAIIIK